MGTTFIAIAAILTLFGSAEATRRLIAPLLPAREGQPCPTCGELHTGDGECVECMLRVW